MGDLFIFYLTVFRSRLGLVNLVVEHSSFVHQPQETLQRRLLKALENTTPIDLKSDQGIRIAEYLDEKKLLGRESGERSGRYKKLTLTKRDGDWAATDVKGSLLDTFPAQQVDLWLSAAGVPSTIGVPTPENIREAIELALQLRVLTKAKNTWTSSAHLLSTLRALSSSSGIANNNPFAIGVERSALLRQIIDTDGLFLRELVREIVTLPDEFRRDDLIPRFENIVARTLASAAKIPARKHDLRGAKEFAEMIGRTVEKRGTHSSGPGVLEHRLSPRLEWLVDLGFLTKEGMQRNAFAYRQTDELNQLLESMDSTLIASDWGSSVAVDQVKRNLQFKATLPIDFDKGFKSCVIHAFQSLRRAVGPSAIRDIVLLASVLGGSGQSFDQGVNMLIEIAREDPSFRLSGGRYSRSPENIFIG